MKDRISNTSSNQKKTNANKEFEGEKVKAKRKKKGKNAFQNRKTEIVQLSSLRINKICLCVLYCTYF